MTTKNYQQYEEFVTQFLKFYLSNGIGSMSKSDIDALVMHLLDNFSTTLGTPLKVKSNYDVSVQLKASIPKIKKLRYDAGLKYSVKNSDEAKLRFVNCLNRASFDFSSDGSDDKIHLIIEDQLAKDWIQGAIKKSALVFDNSFNSEMIKLSSEEFFKVISMFLDTRVVKTFSDKLLILKRDKKNKELKEGVKSLLVDIGKNLLISSI